jgi:hypothetical protein
MRSVGRGRQDARVEILQPQRVRLPLAVAQGEQDDRRMGLEG